MGEECAVRALNAVRAVRRVQPAGGRARDCPRRVGGPVLLCSIKAARRLARLLPLAFLQRPTIHKQICFPPIKVGAFLFICRPRLARASPPSRDARRPRSFLAAPSGQQITRRPPTRMAVARCPDRFISQSSGSLAELLADLLRGARKGSGRRGVRAEGRQASGARGQRGAPEGGQGGESVPR